MPASPALLAESRTPAHLGPVSFRDGSHISQIRLTEERPRASVTSPQIVLHPSTLPTDPRSPGSREGAGCPRPRGTTSPLAHPRDADGDARQRNECLDPGLGAWDPVPLSTELRAGGIEPALSGVSLMSVPHSAPLSHKGSPRGVQREETRGGKTLGPQGSWQSHSRRPHARREPGVGAECDQKHPRSWALAGAAQPAGLDHTYHCHQLWAVWNPQSRPLSEDVAPGSSRLASLAPTGDTPRLDSARPQPTLLPGSPTSSLFTPSWDPAKVAQSCGRRAGELGHSVPGASLAPCPRPSNRILPPGPRTPVCWD